MKTDTTPIPVDTTIPPRIAHQYCPCQARDEAAVVTALCGKTVLIEGRVPRPTTQRCGDCVKLPGSHPCPVCGHTVYT